MSTWCFFRMWLCLWLTKRPVLTVEPAGISSGMALSAGRVSVHASPQSHYQLTPVTHMAVRTGSHLWAIRHLNMVYFTAQFSRRKLPVRHKLQWGSEPRQKGELLQSKETANSACSYFLKLRNTSKYLCAVISQNGTWSEYQNRGRLTVKPTPQNYPGKDWILRLKIMKS